jgi:hypothetical protein
MFRACSEPDLQNCKMNRQARLILKIKFHFTDDLKLSIK